MYTFEEMQAVAKAAQDAVGIVSQTGRLRMLAPVLNVVAYACAGGDGHMDMHAEMQVTFDWVDGRWRLSEIHRH